MKRYEPKIIEPKWQQVWADTQVYAARTGDPRPKYYMLTEFPYPSGDGLHAGHAREYTIGDVISRYKRMQGHNVLYPMGWDAFGLPTENYAIKHKIKPQDATKANTDNFRRQMQSLGYGFDWSREINTTDPNYYKWTQWLFLQFLKAGLAYQAEMPINWCPKERTGLANEEVVNGLHERCGTPVEKKLLKQWMLKITAYADRLIEGLAPVDFPPRIADQQINWIGRSEGAEIDFAIGDHVKPKDSLKFTPELTQLVLDGSKTNTIRLEAKDLKVGDWATLFTRFSPTETRAFAHAKITNVETKRLVDIPADFAGHEPFRSQDEQLASYRKYYGDSVNLDTEFTIYHFDSISPVITVYTTRPDTLAGATFLVLAPEHPAVAKVTTPAQKAAVDKYVQEAQRETDLDRQEEERPKTGVFTGAYTENPITHEKMPVWVADYVLMGYGTGAIMAVPAHDERDHAFAKAHELPIKQVVAPRIIDQSNPHQPGKPVVQRDAVQAIIKHPTEDKFIALHWKKQPWRTFVIGGIETGEDPVTAAIREVREETGYLHLKPVKQYPWVINSQFYAAHKQENRDAMMRWVYFELEDLEQEETAAEEQAMHEVVWTDFSHMQNLAPVMEMPYILRWLERGDEAITGEGPLINSGQFDGLEGTEAKRAVTKWLFEQGIGRGATQYRLRDWIFSRQHYWGEPIPVVHCPKDGVVPVPDDQLPVTLPEVEHYEPTDTGESPLAAITDWVNTTCTVCGGPAKRETDTMPNWAGSSWYWLRYADPQNPKEFAAKDKLEYWTPVDLYLGGMEHTTLHLLYSRFWHQFLYDQKLVPTPEPYAARRGQGIVLAADGRKMSKSLGNVINPTDIIARYGADAFRLYIMFMAPYDETTPWSDERLNGVSRFVYRVWTLAQELIANHAPVTGAAEINTGELATAVDRATHKTLKKVHDDLEGLRFNTMVSTLMEFVNFLNEPKTRSALTDPANAALAQRTVRALVLMLAPAAPHITEELWHELGEEGSVHTAPWPAYDPALIKDDVVTIIVQVNGKVRGQIVAAPDTPEADLINLATAEPHVAAYLDGQTIAKTIVVPRKLVNFVVR